MENEYAEYEPTQELCITCSTPIADHLVQCDECATALYELIRPRCCECKQPLKFTETICNECSWKFFRSDLKQLCEFQVFEREWWALLHDVLRISVPDLVRRRVQR